MSQSGYTPILIYGSATATAVPTAGNLTSSANGAELALNYTDGKLYYKDNGGTVRLLADKISVSVASANGFAGTVAQATATSTPAITLTTSVNGIIYGNGTAMQAVTVGSGLSFVSGTLSATSTGVTTISFGTTGLTPATATGGAVTVAGTLAIANGGTNGSATPTAGGVSYGTGSAYAFTAQGVPGQVLTSNGAAAPSFQALTVTDNSLLYYFFT
jgi:hypothetical protein